MTAPSPSPLVLTVTCRSQARPCRALRGLADRLAQCGGRVHLDVRTMDADTPLTVALPLLTLRDGARALGTLLAPRDAAEVCRWVRSLLPPPPAQVRAKARRWMRESRAEDAAALLRSLPVQQDRETRALLARCLAFHAPLEALCLVERETDARGDARIAIGLAQAVLRADHPAGSTRQEMAYLQALRHLRDQHFMTAAAGLIDVLDADPGYDAGGATATCAALFAHLGPRHPVCVQHRSRHAQLRQCSPKKNRAAP